MAYRILAFLFMFAAGAVVGQAVMPPFLPHLQESGTVMAQTRRPIYATRLYTGPDSLTHSEEVEIDFSTGHPGEISKVFQVSGAQFHRTAAGSVEDWHPAPRRQYVITLSGHGEIEVAGGKKISVGPGHIDLVEDTTGKGHVTRVIGMEDRLTLQLPLADQSER